MNPSTHWSHVPVCVLLCVRRIYANAQIPITCDHFARTRAKDLIIHGLRYHFLLHLLNLWDYGLLNAQHVQHCIAIVDTVGLTGEPVPIPEEARGLIELEQFSGTSESSDSRQPRRWSEALLTDDADDASSAMDVDEEMSAVLDTPAPSSSASASAAVAPSRQTDDSPTLQDIVSTTTEEDGCHSDTDLTSPAQARVVGSASDPASVSAQFPASTTTDTTTTTVTSAGSGWQSVKGRAARGGKKPRIRGRVARGQTYSLGGQ